jgi:hypothetical protein
VESPRAPVSAPEIVAKKHGAEMIYAIRVPLWWFREERFPRLTLALWLARLVLTHKVRP